MTDLSKLDDAAFKKAWEALSSDERWVAGFLMYQRYEALTAQPARIQEPEAKKGPRLLSPILYSSELHALWQNGFPAGDRPGWPDVDKLYTVMPGQVTVITGWPGSGKSEFQDAVLVNLAKQGWKHAIFSFENQPVSYHLTKLQEKMLGKRFGPGPSARIAEDEIDETLFEIDKSFSFTETTSGSFSLADCLESAAPWLNQFPDNKRSIVIDPWNELEHWRNGNQSETEYVSQQLSMLRNWARTHRVHAFVIAHPAKQQRIDGKLPVPTLDMISGSQHWWNKCDCGIVVHRDQTGNDDVTEIHVKKIRFKHIGRVGMAKLSYSRSDGRYHSISQPLASVGKHWSDDGN